MLALKNIVTIGMVMLFLSFSAITSGFMIPRIPTQTRVSSIGLKSSALYMSKAEGVVKFFSVEKGFGFITTQTGEDIFVHQTAIQTDGFRSLAEGEPVEFDLQEDASRGRKFAINVTGPNGAPVQGSPRNFPPRTNNGWDNNNSNNRGGRDRY